MSDEKDLSLLPIDDLEEKLMAETDLNEMQNIVDIFNISWKKKDIIRTNKLNDLQDKIATQIAERIDKKAGEFSNKDLLDYFKVMQDTISRSDSSIENVKSTAIQINQQNININGGELSKESRDRVADVVKSILAKANMETNMTDNYEANYSIVDEDDIEEDNLKMEENDGESSTM